MNELAAKGQKWFWFAFLIFMGYWSWQIFAFGLAYFEITAEGGLSSSFFLELGRKVFILSLVGLAFYLMDKGFEWPKSAFCTITLIYAGIFFYTFMFGVATWLEDSIGDIEGFILESILIFAFYLTPPFILMFSPAAKAYLKHKQALRKGEIDNLDEQLNQIGNHE